jgi:hypothetical protein
MSGISGWVPGASAHSVRSSSERSLALAVAEEVEAAAGREAARGTAAAPPRSRRRLSFGVIELLGAARVSSGGT